MNRRQYDLKLMLHYLEAASSHAEEIGAFDLRIDIDVVLARARARSWFGRESVAYVHPKPVSESVAQRAGASSASMDEG